MTNEVIAALVADGAELDSKIKAQSERLKEIKAQLVALPPAIYAADNGRTAQVIAPSPAIKPKEEAIDAAREEIGDEPLFKKLFERVVTWRPVDAKSFRRVAAAILPKGKVARVIDLCEVESQPYVIFK